MRKIILAAVFLVSTGTGVSWADGVERRAVTPPPAPLTTQPYTAPTPHFGGTVVDTAQCMTASGDVVKCEGAYVIHGSVIRSETMTPHYESVDPIIHEQGQLDGLFRYASWIRLSLSCANHMGRTALNNMSVAATVKARLCTSKKTRVTPRSLVIIRGVSATMFQRNISVELVLLL